MYSSFSSADRRMRTYLVPGRMLYIYVPGKCFWPPCEPQVWNIKIHQFEVSYQTYRSSRAPHNRQFAFFLATEANRYAQQHNMQTLSTPPKITCHARTARCGLPSRKIQHQTCSAASNSVFSCTITASASDAIFSCSSSR